MTAPPASVDTLRTQPGMRTLPLRLAPGCDLRRSLDAALAGSGCSAGFVLSGIGSLAQAALRFAGAEAATVIPADIEILTLAGSLASNGAHLHMAIALPDGRVLGGHVAPGCTVRTTAEVLLALLPDWHFERVPDTGEAGTGYAELVVSPQPNLNAVPLPDPQATPAIKTAC